MRIIHSALAAAILLAAAATANACTPTEPTAPTAPTAPSQHLRMVNTIVSSDLPGLTYSGECYDDGTLAHVTPDTPRTRADATKLCAASRNDYEYLKSHVPGLADYR